MGPNPFLFCLCQLKIKWYNILVYYMKSNKKSLWKKIIGFGTAILLGAGSATGIGFGAYNIAKKTNVSNDFREGRTIQINLRLFETTTPERKDNIRENIKVDTKGNPIHLYNKEMTEENVKKSCTYLINLLESKGLTNIKVSYGYSYINNNQKFNNNLVFKDGKEPVATLYASFENSEAAFGLNNINDISNEFINDKNVYFALSNTPAYEIEVVKKEYHGVNYQIIPSNGVKDANNTHRTGTMFASENHDPISNDVADSLSILDYKLLKDGKIGDYVLRNGNISKADIGLTLNDTNDENITYFNTAGFGEDNVNFTQLQRDEENKTEDESTYNLNKRQTKEGEVPPEGETSPEGGESDKPTEPKESDKFQTTHTYIIWKNKDGLLDYLNTLISLWYFNAYANKLEGVPTSTDKQDYFNAFFNTSALNYNNGVDKQTRNKINRVIDSLSDTEKSFIIWAAFENGRHGDGNPLSWTPPLMTEYDIIPVIYNFYNSPIFSPVKPTHYNDFTADYQYGCSESVKNGWGFLDSRSHDLDDFLGRYYGGTIDFRNYNIHFEDPNEPKEPTDDEPNPIPDPYWTNSYKIDANDYGTTPEKLANKWNNEIYKFPLIPVGDTELVDNWVGIPPTPGNPGLPGISDKLKILDKMYGNVIPDSEACDPKKDEPTLADVEKKIKDEWDFTLPQNEWAEKNGKLTKCEYNIIKEAFANSVIKPSSIYFNQFISPPTIVNSLGGLNPLYILLIVIGVILFLVGVFVSVRYRIPGMIATLLSGLVFVLSIVVYNFYGYVFSFYSLLAVAISTFISFISPSFLFRNIEKEVSEGSTLPAAIVKSTKKYWKLALDIHIMGILSSLAFLFFGRTGNINFGAMLIISIFLSFILNGIIFFILMLYYVYIIQFDFTSWFMSKKLFLKLKQNNFDQVKKIKFFNKVSFFNKWDYYVVGILAFVGLCGVIVLAVNGPFFSIEFGSSNILVINNFKQFNLTTQEVMDTLGVSSINNYVHDNQLVIYTLNSINVSDATTKLVELIKNKSGLAVDDPKLIELINNINSNTLVTILTSESAIKVVKNALECIGIAIALCAIWSVFSLNIISVIPLALNQVATIIIILGWITLLCVPIDLNIVPIFMFIFMINTVFSTAMLSSIKGSWDRKRAINKHDLADLFNNIISKTNPNYVYVTVGILVFAILGLFSSTSLIFCFLILILSCIYIFFFNGKVLVTSLYGLILLRNIFNKELKLSRSLDHKKYDYDEINEQKIIGINC